MSNFRCLFCLIALLLAASMQPSARAQDDANFDVGLAPFGSYHGGNIDQVALANGSLNVQIPLISYPQRGGKLKMDFVLEYVNRSGDVNWECDDYGDCWGLYNATIPQFYIIDKDEIGLSPSPPSGGCAWDGGYSDYCQFYVPDASGANHLIAPTFGSGSYGAGPWRSVDATGIKASAGYGGISLPIIDSAETAYSSPCLGYITEGEYSSVGTFGEMAREDSNGNEISCTSSAITDSMGRTIPLPTQSESPSDFTGCPSSGAQATQLVLLWNPPGINGGEYQMKFCYYYDTSETMLGDGSPTVDMPLLSRIVLLNNNTAWNFAYTSDTLDNLSQITLPTGGTISYGWYGLYSSGGACPDGNGFDYNATINTRTLDPSDGVDPTQTWTYVPGTPAARVTDPAGNDTVHTFLGACFPYETETQYYNGSSTVGSPVVLKTVTTTDSYNYEPWILSPYNDQVVLNLVPSVVSTTLNDTGQEAESIYTYDSEFTYHQPLFNSFTGDIQSYAPTYTNGTYGLQLTQKDWDWGGDTVLRTTTNTYLALSNSTYLGANLLNLLSSVQIKDGSGTQRAYTTYNYDESGSPSGAHGNQTSIHRWLNTTGGSLVTSNVYNSNGLVTSTTDPNSDTTTYGYSTPDFCPTNSGYAGDGPTSVTNAASQTMYYCYDLNTGPLIKSKDLNSQYTTYTYDGMLRLTGVSYPDGGSDSYTYTDATSDPYVVFQKAITGSMNFQKTDIVNGLGQLIQTATVVPSTTCPGGTAYVNTTYDAMARQNSVSNPGCSSTSSYVTRTLYDPFGRTCLVLPQDNTSTPSGCPTGSVADATATVYSGNTSTVYDEAGIARKSQTDALGRLTAVWEDPSGLDYETVYGYDALDNQTSVSQDSSRSRSFTFDSLSRLTSASNPESGTTNYTYDGDGNLVTKTDARSIETTNSYDALNRLTEKAYSGGTPSTSSVYYYYDGNSPTACSVSFSYGSFPIGHRTAMCDAAGTEAWNYDPMGRPLYDQRKTNGLSPDTTGYTYYLDGSLATLSYPSSNRTIAYAANYGMGPASAIDTTNSIDFVTNAIYDPSGNLTSATYGFNLVNTTIYDPARLQPCRIAVNSSGSTAPNSCVDSSHYGNVRDLQYNFNLGSSDNGSVVGIANNIDTTRSQSFSYDTLNRISVAETGSTYSTSPTHCWGESYVYDSTSSAHAWGNLVQINSPSSSYSGCYQESLNVSANTNNQLHTLSGSDYSYDSDGDMTSDTVHSYTYDAENHLVQVDGTPGTCSSGATECYAYDGDGRRVEKKTSSVSKIYWYDKDGNVLDETDGTGSTSNSSFNEYIFFNGKRIALYSPSVSTSLPIQNPSFETYNALTYSCGTACAYNFGPIPDWDSSSAGSQELNSSYTDVPLPDGTLIMGFTNGGSISQTLSGVSLQPNSTYTLSSYVGSRLDGLSGNYSIQLEAGSTVLASTTGSASSFPWGSWVQESTTYTTGSSPTSGDLGVVLADTNASQSDFDDVRLTVSPGILYYFDDHLGTSRVLADSYGNLCFDADFYPFGGERTPYVDNCDQNYKFTGKERDSESNLDNFGARYNSSTIARFMSPDPDNAGADESDPQTWNGYAYVRDNPTDNTDPDGLGCLYIMGSSSTGGSDNGADFTFNNKDSEDACTGNKGIYIPGNITNVQANHTTNVLTVTVTDPSSNQASSLMVASGQPNPNDTADDDDRMAAVASGAGEANFFLSTPKRAAGSGMTWAQAHPNVMAAILLGLDILSGGEEGIPGEVPRPSPPPDLSNLSVKIQGQIVERGWTHQEILDVYRNGIPGKVPDKTAGFTPATQYIDPATGKFIVVNNSTGNLVQVSGPGYRPNITIK